MIRTFMLVGGTFLGAVLLYASGLNQRIPLLATNGPTYSSTAPTVEKVRGLSELVSAKVYVSDVLLGEAHGAKGAFLIKGDALVGVDMSKAKVTKQEDPSGTKYIVELPPPRVILARVDHTRTKTYDVQSVNWIPFTSDKDKLRDEAMAYAQAGVEQLAASEDTITFARKRAQESVTMLFESTGNNVEVIWTDEPSLQKKDLTSTLKQQTPDRKPDAENK